jgi:hypothetical protein
LFAHEQCKAGAIGITVQKIGEFSPKTEIEDKPQISQMNEACGFKFGF